MPGYIHTPSRLSQMSEIMTYLWIWIFSCYNYNL